MKVIQVLPCLNYGDAIGNDTLALHNALKKNGYHSCIFAEVYDQRIPKGIADTMNHWKEPSNDDVIIYHLSVGWEYIDKIRSAKCRKIAIYHNITPSNYFKSYDLNAFTFCMTGLDEVKELKNDFDYVLADSAFNKQDLISYGYQCKIDVLPILIAFDDYKKQPSKSRMKQLSEIKGAKVLFLGRIVPNKKIEDVIHAFALYRKYYDPEAVLNLVGMYNRNDVYYRQLKEYINRIGETNVYFSGHVKFDEILAYYRSADIFLCMSDHEGFCVPLVESMYFGIPIVAVSSTAIPDTLGGSGFLLQKKDYLEAASAMNRIMTDATLKSQIVQGEKERLKYFDNARIEKLFINDFKTFLDQSK